MKKFQLYIGLFVVIVIFILFTNVAFRDKDILEIKSVNPSPNSEEIAENSQIDIIFKSINDSQKKKIQVTITPEISFDSNWIADTYKIIPKNVLKNNTRYLISIFYSKNKLYDFSFTTQTFSQQDINQYGHLQTQDDFDFGQAQKEFYEKYPFYKYLPIKSKNYIIDFDSFQEKFIITYLNDDFSTIQKEELIKEALEQIKKIGVQEPIKYYTRP